MIEYGYGGTPRWEPKAQEAAVDAGTRELERMARL